jgi:hypothetical protein
VKVSLKDLDFGKDTAEFDKDLAEYFVTTSTYNRVLNGQRSIIAGRKGSGKTALMNYMRADAGPKQCVIALEASQATLLKIKQSVDQLGEDLADLDASFKHAWLFSIMLALSESVMESKFALSADAQRVHAFAKDHLAYRAPDRVAIVGNYILSWFINAKRISVGKISVERDIAASALPIAFDERTLLELIAASTRELNRRKKEVYIFFDKLDERWEASTGNIALVQGLLLAVRELKAMRLDLHPVVLVRDDILRAATETFQHIDHFRMDIETISWNEASLADLLALRIKHSLVRKGYPIDPNLKPSGLWNLVFEPTVPFKKSPIPMAAWLIERTLARPRDLVLFANMALENALSSDSDDVLIGKRHVKAVERNFSEQKYDDLIAELSVEWAGARALLETFRSRPSTFVASELDDLLTEILTKPGLAPDWTPESVEALKAWLYRIGFLCYTKAGGALRGTRVIHSGIEREADEFMTAQKVFVSPIFREALRMKDRRMRITEDSQLDTDDS